MVRSRARRVVCAGVALLTAAALFRSDVALGVVTRGDDALRTGDGVSAARYYRRALWLDPYSLIAADRLAFYLALHHNQRDATEAAVTATSALRNTPDGTLYADRALAEIQLRRWREAEQDFSAAAHLNGDPRYDHFAARMALRRGHRDDARRHELDALTIDRHFAPSRWLLRELR